MYAHARPGVGVTVFEPSEPTNLTIVEGSGKGLEKVPNEVLIAHERKEKVIEEARRLAEEQVAFAAPKLIRTLIDALDDDDPQVRMRAADVLLSRLLPKVAAKHVDTGEGAIESSDTAALRDSILDEIKKKVGNG
jgi:hypothetical protein